MQQACEESIFAVAKNYLRFSLLGGPCAAAAQFRRGGDLCARCAAAVAAMISLISAALVAGILIKFLLLELRLAPLR